VPLPLVAVARQRLTVRGEREREDPPRRVEDVDVVNERRAVPRLRFRGELLLPQGRRAFVLDDDAADGAVDGDPEPVDAGGEVREAVDAERRFAGALIPEEEEERVGGEERLGRFAEQRVGLRQLPLQKVGERREPRRRRAVRRLVVSIRRRREVLPDLSQRARRDARAGAELDVFGRRHGPGSSSSSCARRL
jgi:hypothetical protein